MRLLNSFSFCVCIVCMLCLCVCMLYACVCAYMPLCVCACMCEQTEDITVLRLLLEELQPRPSQLDSEDSCLEWAAHYSTIAPVVLRILSDSELKEGEEGEEVMAVVATLPYGDKCRQQLVAIRWVGLLLPSQATELLKLVLVLYPLVACCSDVSRGIVLQYTPVWPVSVMGAEGLFYSIPLCGLFQ